MSVVRVPVLFRAGGECYERYGVVCHRTTSIAHGGEELQETFTRADATTVASYLDRDGYVRRALANVLRVEYVSGLGYCTLHEASRTNVVLHNRDLTQAAWVKTNVPAAKDQVGTDNTASSASKITAPAANGTCLQAITLASSARYQSAYVKRVTGSGVVNMTTDGGATWTPITVTSAWTRVTIPTQTLTDPSVGFQIVTNGDAIAVDYVQNENGTYPTSAIVTGASAATRVADRLEFPFYAHPQAMTVYAHFIERAAPNWTAEGGAERRIVQVGSSGSNDKTLRIVKTNTTDAYAVHHTNVTPATVTSSVDVNPVYGSRVEVLGTMTAAGAVTASASKDGGTAMVGSTSATQTVDAAWTAQNVYVGTIGGNGNGDIALRSLIIASGVQTMDTMRAL